MGIYNLIKSVENAKSIRHFSDDQPFVPQSKKRLALPDYSHCMKFIRDTNLEVGKFYKIREFKFHGSIEYIVLVLEEFDRYYLVMKNQNIRTTILKAKLICHALEEKEVEIVDTG